MISLQVKSLRVVGREMIRVCFGLVFTALFIMSTGCVNLPDHQDVAYVDQGLDENQAKSIFRQELVNYLVEYKNMFHAVSALSDWTKSSNYAGDPDFEYIGAKTLEDNQGVMFLYKDQGGERYFYILAEVSANAKMRLQSWPYWYAGFGTSERYSITLSESTICWGSGDEPPTVTDDGYSMKYTRSNHEVGLVSSHVQGISCLGGREADHASQIAYMAAHNGKSALPGYAEGDAVLTFKEESNMQRMANVLKELFISPK